MGVSIVSKKTVDVTIGENTIEVTFRVPTGSEANAIASQRAQALAHEDAHKKNAAFYEHMCSVLPSVISSIKGIELDGEPFVLSGTDEEKSKQLDRISFCVPFIYTAYLGLSALSEGTKKK